jgi:hypothetical protein
MRRQTVCCLLRKTEPSMAGSVATREREKKKETSTEREERE